jgi:hypothetical protein
VGASADADVVGGICREAECFGRVPVPGGDERLEQRSSLHAGMSEEKKVRRV